MIDELRAGTLVQVAPGRWALRRPDLDPELVVCQTAKLPDGTIELRPVEEQWAKLNTGLARLLGFAGEYQTIHRLMQGGFVEGVRVAPNTTLLNLQSWWNHLRRCSEDPEFWDRDSKRGQKNVDWFNKNKF